MKPASALVQLGIPLLAIVVAGGVVTWVHRSAPPTLRLRTTMRVGVGIGLWFAFSAALAGTGFLANFDATPPRAPLLLIPTLLLPTWLGFSRVGTYMTKATPIVWLVGFHGFRLPLELLMHQAARDGTMPEQMSYSGLNFDILTGVSALLLAGYSLVTRRELPRFAVLAFNLLGTLLLIAIVAIAVASLPMFHAFGTEPERLNTWVATFPFVWLPAGLVASATLGHVVLWRRLLAKPG
jgi:hypothetical protein